MHQKSSLFEKPPHIFTGHLRTETMESSSEIDVPAIIDGEPDQEVAPPIAQGIGENHNFNEGIRLFRGVLVATLFSIPIWALILWIIF